MNLEQAIVELNADADAVVKRAEGISPQLIATLNNFANRELAGKLAENFNVLAILSGKNGKRQSVAEIANQFLGDTGLGDILKNVQLHGHIGDAGSKILSGLGGGTEEE